MKAAVRSKYGPPEVLSIKELEIPTPRENEVLIRVYASTANRSDYHVLMGRPFLMRLFTGLFKPKRAVIGTDFAGQIESVGAGISAFKKGDKVMGFGGGFGCGAHAQYFILPETKALKCIVTIPEKLRYEQAAACLEGAFYAASGLIALNPKAGQKALVYGATGAIGSSHVQILKYYGLSVTAVCAGEHGELVRSLGADRIIDYKKDDFTKDNEQYDYVFDSIGKSSFAKCKRLLTKKGIYFPSNGLENIFLVPITRLLGGKRVGFPALKSYNGTLVFIKELVEKGRFRPVIDRTYPLDKIGEAFTYVATGQKIGNVVITMDEI